MHSIYCFLLYALATKKAATKPREREMEREQLLRESEREGERGVSNYAI